jgi:hypothetical protein
LTDKRRNLPRYVKETHKCNIGNCSAYSLCNRATLTNLRFALEVRRDHNHPADHVKTAAFVLEKKIAARALQPHESLGHAYEEAVADVDLEVRGVLRTRSKMQSMSSRQKSKVIYC